jgi:hypothetical protein
MQPFLALPSNAVLCRGLPGDPRLELGLDSSQPQQQRTISGPQDTNGESLSN